MDFLILLRNLSQNLVQVLLIRLGWAVFAIVKKPSFGFSGAFDDKLLEIVEKTGFGLEF